MSRESEDIDEECCICLSRPPTVLLLPCGHGALCGACYDVMVRSRGGGGIRCPLCRSDVEGAYLYSASQIREISRRTASDELHTDTSDPIVGLGLQRVRAGRQWLREAHQRHEAQQRREQDDLEAGANHSWSDDAYEDDSPQEIDAHDMREQRQREQRQREQRQREQRQREQRQRAQQEAELAQQQAENAWLYDSNSEGFDDEWSDDSNLSSSGSGRPDWGTSRLDTGRWLPATRDDFHETYPARRPGQEGAAGAREGGRADMPMNAQLHCMLGQLQTCLYNNRRT
jgi:hypothetical protein